MCTLVLAWQVFEETPIAAAANRDEATGRPSRPPGILDENPRVVAPQDAEAGGTWIGYNDAGLFVAVTNRRREPATAADSSGPAASGSDEATGFEADRSRGLLVRDALGHESAREAVSFVRDELAGREYDGFNLVVADAEDATLLEWDGVLRATHFDPGVHVVVNAGYNGAAPKAAAIREAVRPAVGDDRDPESEGGRATESEGGRAADAPAEPGSVYDSAPEADAAAWFERAKAVLRDHDLETCVHGADFGTRSSSLIAIDAAGAGRYWFADGRPCETDYEAVSVDGEEGFAAGDEEDFAVDDEDGHI